MVEVSSWEFVKGSATYTYLGSICLLGAWTLLAEDKHVVGTCQNLLSAYPEAKQLFAQIAAA